MPFTNQKVSHSLWEKHEAFWGNFFASGKDVIFSTPVHYTPYNFADLLLRPPPVVKPLEGEGAEMEIRKQLVLRDQIC